MPIELRWNCHTGTCLTLWHITEHRNQLAQMYNQIWGDDANPQTTKSASPQKLAARNLIGTEFPAHQLVFSEYGKPLLLPHSAHINHSHAGDFALLAHHPNLSVGVDIEQIRPQLLRIYPRFCNSQEQMALGPNPPLELLLLFWCAKEAMYKAIGEKGTDFRSYLQITKWPLNNDPFKDPYDSEGQLEAQISLPGFEQSCSLNFKRWDQYAAVWVVLPNP